MDAIAYDLWDKLKRNIDETGKGTYHMHGLNNTRKNKAIRAAQESALRQLEEADYIKIVSRIKNTVVYDTGISSELLAEIE